MIIVPAGPARRARVTLAPNLSVLEAVAKALEPLDWPSATLLILGGPLARAVYTCSVLTPSGPRWIDYGPQRDLGPCWLAMGSATFGTALDGGPALHIHAMLSDDHANPQGGHLVPDISFIGPEPLTAHATSGPDAGFRITRDPSGFNLLSPQCH